MDKDGAVHRMADEDRSVFEVLERLQQGLPGRIARVGFIRHSRIEDGVPRAELALEAADQLVVPRAMHRLAAALHEKGSAWASRRPPLQCRNAARMRIPCVSSRQALQAPP